ncbi:hypothetical protein [Streptomyces sp. SID8375]|uniref:hypothetical protein n=1 Tax=Streptomyces sp. SID8375 TaxID=2690355 RepID=UPI001F229E9B|nr:hypothetical protein [Streptomyces sp. SID8375]
MLSETDVLQAVRQHIAERGEAPKMGQPTSGEITWHSLLEGTIVRCIETRTENKQLHRGRIDLSDRPRYDRLEQYPLAPPKNPGAALTLELVQRGSVNEDPCPCGNGKVACSRCQGRGDLPCASTTTCSDCRGIDACLRCDGTGHRTHKASEEARQVAEERVTCKKCGAFEAACPTCRGRGHITCSTCRGRGVRECPDCDGEGTEPHKRCGGTGLTVAWTEGIISRQPRTEEIKWPESGLPYVARQHARQDGDWRKTSLTHKDSVPDGLEGEFKALLKPRLKPRDGEIARKADLQYLPLARVVVPEHRHRVYYVYPGQSKLRVFILPSSQRTWQIAGAVLAVLAVLYLLSRLLS